MKKIIATFVSCFFYSSLILAQVSEGGQPYSWQNSEEISAPKAVNYNPVSLPKVKNSELPKNGSFTFAELINIEKSTDNFGQWTELLNGDKIWLVKLKSAGAYSLNVIFDKYLLPEGAELFIYSADKKYKIGAFTHENNKKYGTLATAAIPGDEIIIEYYEPEDADFAGELIVGTLGHDYLNAFGFKDGQFGVSGSCNIDINCDEGDNWQTHKRSVVRMISNGTGLCTGVLLNNVNQDQKPIVLTAAHCFIENKTPENTVFYFNYESPSCKGSDGNTSQTVSGSVLLADKEKNEGYLDFSLVEMSSSVPLSYKPYFAGWDTRGNVPQSAICIHHPWGDVKKISVDEDASEQDSYVGYGYDPNTFWRIMEWDAGMTQGGSSGSPLFDENGRVVGSLSGGDARDCDDEPLNDYYQMFSIAYDKYEADSTQLKAWLDPNNSGIEFLNGLDTQSGEREIGDLIAVKHWEEEEDWVIYTVPDNGGYVAGNNMYQDKAKAEFFDQSQFDNRNIITTAYAAFYTAIGNDDTDIELQILNDNNNSPGEVLGSSMVKIKDIKESINKEFVIFSFDPPVEINSSVYLSLVLPQATGDTVVLLTTEDKDDNTAWDLDANNQWQPYSQVWNLNLAHIMALEIGSYTAIQSYDTAKSLNIFPNPAADQITVNLGNTPNQPTLVNIYNTYGSLVKSISTNSDALNVNISVLEDGFYVLTATNDSGFYSGKFVKE